MVWKESMSRPQCKIHENGKETIWAHLNEPYVQEEYMNQRNLALNIENSAKTMVETVGGIYMK